MKIFSDIVRASTVASLSTVALHSSVARLGKIRATLNAVHIIPLLVSVQLPKFTETQTRRISAPVCVPFADPHKHWRKRKGCSPTILLLRPDNSMGGYGQFRRVK